MKKQSPQSAEIGEVIEAGANYEELRRDNPFAVKGMKPGMAYFWASKEPGYTSQNVAGIKMLGYVVSEIEHDHPDCVLMECPQEMVDRRRNADLVQDARNRNASMEKPKGIPEEHHGGGAFQLPGHGGS